MKIESIIQREGGTVVQFDNSPAYHFKPEAPGEAHIAVVENKEHIERLLAIPEGYRAFKALPEKPEAASSPVAAHVLQGEGGVGEAGGDSEPPAAPRKTARKPKSEA